jgi:hypothetical protein
VTGKEFFPHLLAGPLMVGLRYAFTFSLILYVLSALASWIGGTAIVHTSERIIAEDRAGTARAS